MPEEDAMDVWKEADEVILLAELHIGPVPQPLPAWQRDLLGCFFPDPLSAGGRTDGA